MASYPPAISFHPCPWRASDIIKPHPAPPPTSYLEDHVRIVYNDGDWPPTPEGEGISEEQDKLTYQPTVAVVNACTKSAMVSAQPLSLLLAKMREYTRKGEPGHGGSDREYVFKLGQVVSSAEQPMSAAKADIPQAEVPILESSKVVTRSRMNSCAPHTALGPANVMKKPATKPSDRIQVVPSHARGEKENFPLISPDSDDHLDDFLQAAGPHTTPGEDARWQKLHTFMNIDLSNPFLDSDEEYEEYEDLASGRWRENRDARAKEETYSDQEISSFEYASSYPTVPMIWTKLDSNAALAHSSPPQTGTTSRGRTDQPKALSIALQMPLISGARLVSNLGPSV